MFLQYEVLLFILAIRLEQHDGDRLGIQEIGSRLGKSIHAESDPGDSRFRFDQCF
jgi:hypothetical protein